MPTITAIEGIGEAYAKKLRAAGIRTTEALLEKGGKPKGRKELAEATGFSEAVILDWVNRADLFRVTGIGVQFSDLLEAAGVDTVRELATRKPAALVETLAEANAKTNKVNRLPTLKEVEGWVAAAKALPRMIKY